MTKEHEINPLHEITLGEIRTLEKYVNMNKEGADYMPSVQNILGLAKAIYAVQERLEILENKE